MSFLRQVVQGGLQVLAVACLQVQEAVGLGRDATLLVAVNEPVAGLLDVAKGLLVARHFVVPPHAFEEDTRLEAEVEVAAAMDAQHIGRPPNPLALAGEHIALIAEIHDRARPARLAVVIIRVGPSVAVVEDHLRHIARAVVPEKVPPLDDLRDLVVVEEIGDINLRCLVVARVRGVDADMVRRRAIAAAADQVGPGRVVYDVDIRHVQRVGLEVVEVFEVARPQELHAHHVRIAIVVAVPGDVLGHIDVGRPDIVDTIAEPEETIRIGLDALEGPRIVKRLVSAVRQLECGVEPRHLLGEGAVKLRATRLAVVAQALRVPAVPLWWGKRTQRPLQAGKNAVELLSIGVARMEEQSYFVSPCDAGVDIQRCGAPSRIEAHVKPSLRIEFDGLGMQLPEPFDPGGQSLRLVRQVAPTDGRGLCPLAAAATGHGTTEDVLAGGCLVKVRFRLLGQPAFVDPAVLCAKGACPLPHRGGQFEEEAVESDLVWLLALAIQESDDRLDAGTACVGIEATVEIKLLFPSGIAKRSGGMDDRVQRPFLFEDHARVGVKACEVLLASDGHAQSATVTADDGLAIHLRRVDQVEVFLPHLEDQRAGIDKESFIGFREAKSLLVLRGRLAQCKSDGRLAVRGAAGGEDQMHPSQRPVIPPTVHRDNLRLQRLSSLQEAQVLHPFDVALGQWYSDGDPLTLALHAGSFHHR